MMDFELKLEKPNVSRAWISAATMGVSFFIGVSARSGPLPLLLTDKTSVTDYILFSFKVASFL